MDYYTNLANKFRIKYKEYSQLYNHLLTNSSTNDNMVVIQIIRKI